MAARYVYFFGDGTSGDPARKDILGGKGASLAALSQAGLPVPPGFTISAECCPLYLESGGRWPDGLEDEVRTAMTRLETATGRVFGAFPKPLLVSVRSGAAVSMPGMMDTLLNCGISPAMAEPGRKGVWMVYGQFVQMFGKTVAGIPMAEFQRVSGHGDSEDAQERAARQCAELYATRTGQAFPGNPWTALRACIEAVFRSWDSERAKAYRKQHDIRNLRGTAVTVQSMFPSEISGIVFTADPNGLNTDEMIVESSYGLGEAVVSGDVTPDRFVLSRQTLETLKTVPGNKAHAVRALGDTAERDPHALSLTPDRLRELGRLSMQVETHFKAPVDLEWGWADGRFALLQARPIRGLEIIRDIETGRQEEIARLKGMLNGRRRVWVAHNLGETLPSPTPLTWDIVRKFMSGDGGFGRLYRDFGYQPGERVCREGFLELICGRIYADPDRAAELFWEGMPLEYDIEAILQDQGVMEAPPGKFNPDKAGGSFLLRLPGTLLAMLRSARRMSGLRTAVAERFERQVLPEFLAYVKQKRAQDLRTLATSELFSELEARRHRVLDEFANESLKPGFFGGMARARLEALLTQILGPAEGKRLALELTMGLDGDLTVRQNELLYRVGEGAARLEDFLEQYGHRAVGEMELAEPRWREDPGYLERIIASYRQGGAANPAERHQLNVERRKACEAQLPGLLARWGASALEAEVRAHLAEAQRLLPYRENGKYYLMQGYELIRLALVECARRWDLGRDLFFLQWDELPRLEQEREALLQAAARRKIRWQSARKLELPAVIDSRELEQLGQPRVCAAASELKGECIAAGVFTGPARIVHDPKEVRDLGSGFVLVCPSTDPGWTALFVHAKGLVIERGGVLSHGAIVARDFGIPAVVCPEATRRIREGALVRVDGNRGLVTLAEQDV